RQMARAEACRARGNTVRAAILRQRAAHVAAPSLHETARATARSELDELARRLHKALDLNDTDADSWEKVLPALLIPAAIGLWPVEARLLYDLQKVCADHEREIYALDLVGWLLSFGRQPIKRLLPNQRLVLMVKHLGGAARRLAACRIADAER